jgi:uncharacterized membrane protein
MDKINVERNKTMSQFLVASSVWLHALATIVFIGHYVLLALIYMPVLAKNDPEIAGGAILAEVSRRSRVWMYVSLLIFAITGIYITFVDPNYLGLGNFGNPWAILMLIKHILILGMIAAGFWFNAIMRVGPMLSSKTGSEQASNRFRLYVNVMAIAGILVLLLTAFSQVQ